MKQRILVTGAGGFLGRALLSEIRKNKNAAALGIGRGIKSTAITRPCDLFKPAQVRLVLNQFKPTVIFHLAGAPSRSSPSELKKSYLISTRNLLKAMALLPSGRVILAGSSTIYGRPRQAQQIFRENSPARPVTPYGRAKREQEKIVLSSVPNSWDAVVARIFNLVGPDCPEHLVLGSWASQVARLGKGKSPGVVRVGQIENRRDFVDTRDVAKALVLLMKKGKPGGIYNVSSGRAEPLRKLLDLLLSAARIRSRISVVKDPSRLRKRSMDPPIIKGSFAKLSSLCGWKPKISLKKSVTDALVSARKTLKKR